MYTNSFKITVDTYNLVLLLRIAQNERRTLNRNTRRITEEKPLNLKNSKKVPNKVN